MPDRKTVYTTDDGANVGFFQFRADRAGDLSSGSLWAAKMTQLSAANGGSFTMSECRWRSAAAGPARLSPPF